MAIFSLPTLPTPNAFPVPVPEAQGGISSNSLIVNSNNFSLNVPSAPRFIDVAQENIAAPFISVASNVINSLTNYPASISTGLANSIDVIEDTLYLLGATKATQRAINVIEPFGLPESQAETVVDLQRTLSPLQDTPGGQFVDQQMWEIKATLTNYSPPVRPVFIPSNYIIEMVIEQNILDPCYLRGSMIIKGNRMGLLDNKDPEKAIDLELLLRGDGKDEILIELKPLFADGDLSPETWNIKTEFIVYDSEDIPWTDEVGYVKKIYFWHRAYQIMLERSIPFSTSNYYSQTLVEKATNEDRMLPTGEVILRLLEEGGLSSFIDYSEWDIGNLDSKIFYTSNSQNNILEDLYNVLPYYIASDNAPGILYFHRGRNKFQLLSLRKLFENAGIQIPGIYYYETFILGVGYGGSQDSEQPNITPNKTPQINGSGEDLGILMKKYNLINDYNLLEGSGADSAQGLVSQMVYTYDHKAKTFKTSYELSEIKNHKKYFKEEFTDFLYPGTVSSPLLPLNLAKKNQHKTRQTFQNAVTKTYDAVAYTGRSFLVKSSIFLNLGIQFKVQGSTHRHAGRFIGIDKEKNSDNKFDFRLLGQWLTTSVTTRWSGGSLYNEIVANKVNSFEDLRFNENI